MSIARTLGLAAGVALVLGLALFFYAGARIEDWLNRVEPVPVPAVSAEARRLHAASFVADMHADSLLFGRDLVARGRVGHVDLPRLRDGGVALQIFTAVTRIPLGLNIDATDGDRFDLLTLAGAARLSPFLTLGPHGRALLQAERLRDAIGRAGGALVPVRTIGELDALAARRAVDPEVVGALFGLEGAHALEGDLGKLEPLYAAGVRMIGLTHFFDNAFAGSAHGLEKHGLTDLGRALVRRMQARGVLVDLAHLAAAAIDDVLAMTTRPVVVSHGGVRATCDNARNLSDAQVRAIAAAGGVIGIGYWETAVCGTTMVHVTAAIRHVVDLVGPDHAGLGSDFDGAITTGFDASALPSLTQQMLDDGLPPETIRKVLGGNVLRVLRQTLPRERPRG